MPLRVDVVPDEGEQYVAPSDLLSLLRSHIRGVRTMEIQTPGGRGHEILSAKIEHGHLVLKMTN